MKIFSALGTGDIVGAMRARLEGRALPGIGHPYSEQFFELCRERGFQSLGVSSNDRVDSISENAIEACNIPKRPYRGPVQYHVAQLRYAVDLARLARRFGAKVAIIDSGTTHYFALLIFRMLGIKIVINLHNALHPPGYPPI